MNGLHRCFSSFVILGFAVALSGCGARSMAPPSLSPEAFQRVQSADVRDAGTQVFTLGDGGTNAAWVMGLSTGADGQLYYSVGAASSGCPSPTSGEIGSFNVSTHAQSYQTVAYWPGFLLETAHGLWVEEVNNTSGNPTIDHYTAVGGTDTPVSIPIGPFSCVYFGNGIGGGIAAGADGELWWGSDNSPQVGEIDQTTNGVSVYTLGTPAGGLVPQPQFMVSASDKNIWVTDTSNDAVFRVVGIGTSKGTSTYTILPQGESYNPILEGITEGSDHKLYTGSEYLSSSSISGYLDSGAPAKSPAFSSIALPSAGSFPYILAPSKTKIYYNDFIWGGLGSYDPATGELVILPLRNPLGASGVGGITVDASGTPWVGCTITNGTTQIACIESVKLTATWKVYPSGSIKLYTQSQQGTPLPPGLIGIGETGNSGPFTVMSSDTTICTASVISGFDHNIQVNPVKAGKCTLSITDAHSRTVNVAVQVIKGKGYPYARVRPVRGRNVPLWPSQE